MNTDALRRHRAAWRIVRWLSGAALGWTSCAAAPGVAGDGVASVPLFARDHHPFVALYGIPPPERIAPLARGRTELRLTLDVANHSIEERAGDETILLDGETYRTTLVLRAGLGSGWEIGLDVPYVRSRRARMDGFIDDWHDLLGIRTPNRDDFDVERLLLRYTDDGETLELGAADGGAGDARASVTRSWSDGGARRVALRLGVQLPSGDESRLSGIGTASVSFDVAATRRFALLERPAWTYARVGLVAAGEGGLLEHRRRSRVGYANLGAGWQIASRLTFKLQLDAHQSAYRSALGPFGDDAFQVSVGGAWRLTRATTLELAVQENVRRDPVPDVTLQVGLGRRF